MVFYSYESVFCLFFQIRIIKGIEMDGKELLDGERSGSLYRNFSFSFGEVADQRQGLPFCPNWRKPDEGPNTLS